jgi:hypothetical protein
MSSEGLVKQIRLSALGVDVSMSSEEGKESCGLIPPNQKLGRRITKEPADIR